MTVAASLTSILRTLMFIMTTTINISLWCMFSLKQNMEKRKLILGLSTNFCILYDQLTNDY